MKVPVRGGIITLRDRLDFQSGHAIRSALAVAREEMKSSYGIPPEGTLPPEATYDLTAAVTLHEVLRGIESWAGEDFDGKPVTRQNIHDLVLNDPDRSMAVGNAAENLYLDEVIGPLVTLAASSSPPSPTDEPTSAPTGSSSTSAAGSNGSTPSPKPPKRSRRSSTSTTQTGSTETTSDEPGGVSSS